MAYTDPEFRLGMRLVRKWMRDNGYPIPRTKKTKNNKAPAAASPSGLRARRCPLHPPPQVGEEQVPLQSTDARHPYDRARAAA